MQGLKHQTFNPAAALLISIKVRTSYVGMLKQHLIL